MWGGEHRKQTVLSVRATAALGQGLTWHMKLLAQLAGEVPIKLLLVIPVPVAYRCLCSLSYQEPWQSITLLLNASGAYQKPEVKVVYRPSPHIRALRTIRSPHHIL